jgi:hypothetical protein
VGSMAVGGVAAGAAVTTRAVTIAAYLAVAAVMVALYVAGRARRFGLAPLGEVVDAVRAFRSGRLVLIVCWAWVGWHFLAR